LYHHHRHGYRLHGARHALWSGPAGLGSEILAYRPRFDRPGAFGGPGFCPLPANPAPASEPATARPAAAQKPIRLRVCIGRNCTKKGGGRALIDALKREIANRGEEDRFDVRPCDCLGACDKGPSVLAVYGTETDARSVSIYHAAAAHAKGIVDDIAAEIRSEKTP